MIELDRNGIPLSLGSKCVADFAYGLDWKDIESSSTYSANRTVSPPVGLISTANHPGQEQG
jgi:hypothetical protein